MAETGPQTRTVAPAAAVAQLAGDLLADFTAAAPDLTGAVVVLPNPHAAGPLARALGTAAGQGLLLPKMTTLSLWAGERLSSRRPVPEPLREAALFAALRSRKWFDAADLWPLAGELSRLFDELTCFEVVLPASVEEFERALEKAYQTRAGEAMQFEARLVYELWHASAQPRDGALDSAGLYQLQLAELASEATQPLYAIGLPAMIPAERAFFETYARRAPVTLYDVHANAAGASQAARFYASVWPAPTGQQTVLCERAAAFAHACPASPVATNVRLYGAPNLEQEARAVESQVRVWLTEQRKRIAVVALDRMVARRARALLERAAVLTDDETGWLFSTTSASTVIIRWLDAVSSGFYYKELLDLVKSPFIFSGWAERREAVYQLEVAIRRHSVVAGLDACRSVLTLVASEDAGCALELLGRLARAARIMQRDKRRRLHDWCALLFGSLAALGVEDGLKGDPAGLQLVDYLQRLARDLGSSEELFSFAEWRRWLDRQLESAEFRDSGISSPVIFTQLSLTRLRTFDAVVLTGCDASHLPGIDPSSVFFNQSVRAQLGLPTSEQRLAQISEDLTGLLSRSADVLVTWQKLRDGEENLLSPLIERVNVFHQLAWGATLEDDGVDDWLPLAQVAAPQPAPLPTVTSRPAPVAAPGRLPSRISASGYNSLVACPYQFYGRYVLGLREAEEVRETTEKRDYGEYVHRILRRFHEQFPVCSGVDRERLEAALHEISAQVFRQATEASYMAHAWALRWQAAIPAYLDWQLDREGRGWRFHAAESSREIDVELPDGTGLVLEGRLDRIDMCEQGGADVFAVIDYKARAAAALRRSLREPGEDVQLPVYVALLGTAARQACFVSIDGKEVASVCAGDEAGSQADQALQRLKTVFTQMRNGAPLPAQGIDNECRWCELPGLCRKHYWS